MSCMLDQTLMVQILTHPNSIPHGFGTWSVLLTMAMAHAPKIRLAMWTSALCSLFFHNVITPRGTPSSPSIQPILVQNANMPTMARLEGVGRPSKYFDFPVASAGMSAMVALKRARRARPQQMKQVRMTVSSHVRKPTANASTAGATTKEIYGCYGVNKLGDRNKRENWSVRDQQDCRVLAPVG